MVDLVVDRQPEGASSSMRSHVENSLTDPALATELGTTAFVG